MNLTWSPHQESPGVFVNMSLVHLKWSSCCVRAEDRPDKMSVVMPPEIWALKYCISWMNAGLRVSFQFRCQKWTPCCAAASPLGVGTASPSSVGSGAPESLAPLAVGPEDPPTPSTGCPAASPQLCPACPHCHTCPHVRDTLGTLFEFPAAFGSMVACRPT